ncbi:conserved hypothetical protein [Trichinella spiralis]|uniref:hypothetical protein n=1 Tax=Trichinella spiralis TaxID=6334 RepID=UPI0001EFC09E|nr:conserved hypothetical protein [Trichinella spiralis]
MQLRFNLDACSTNTRPAREATDYGPLDVDHRKLNETNFKWETSLDGSSFGLYTETKHFQQYGRLYCHFKQDVPEETMGLRTAAKADNNAPATRCNCTKGCQSMWYQRAFLQQCMPQFCSMY